MKSQFKQTSKRINDEVNHVLKEIDEQQIDLVMNDVLSKNRIFIAYYLGSTRLIDNI